MESVNLETGHRELNDIMKTGMMNNPQIPISDEMQYLVEKDFDFIDFTMEPPFGTIDGKNARYWKNFLDENGKFSIGHTAYYLPIDSPFTSLRKETADILCRQMDVFHELGTQKITLHLNFSYPHRMFSFADKLGFWTEMVEYLSKEASIRGISLLLENVLNTREAIKLLKLLFKKNRSLEFLLDVGHANLNVPVNSVYDYLKHFKHQLNHIHLSDNFGRSDDLHLPLGAGGIPWKHVLKQIKNTGYDKTFTLEVFSREREYLLYSREFLRTTWKSL